MSWIDELDIAQAMLNIKYEIVNDWYRDPWGWPENIFIAGAGRDIALQHFRNMRPRRFSQIDVPKENFGMRPAVVLDPLDKVAYQAFVDRISTDLIGSMRPQVLGWRLPPGFGRTPGRYARNDYQANMYRARVGLLSDVMKYAMKTDMSSYFASVPIHGVAVELHRRTIHKPIIDRLMVMLHTWQLIPGRSGLPQRSTASAVIGNMMLMPIDDLLVRHVGRIPDNVLKLGGQPGYVRWMDDVWLFHEDPGKIRAAQVELQAQLREMGLALNMGKTELLEGADLQEKAKKIEHSAVDNDLLDLGKTTPDSLKALVDRIIHEGEKVDSSLVRFATTRMRRYDIRYRLDDLGDAAFCMPHAADSMARLFRHFWRSAEIQDWLQDYFRSSWNCFEWSVAQFGTAIPSRRAPRQAILNIFEGVIQGTVDSLPLVALAAQRLASWKPKDARDMLHARLQGEENHLIRRVLVLACLMCGDGPVAAKKLLGELPENQLTLQMLKSRSFVAPKVTKDYY